MGGFSRFGGNAAIVRSPIVEMPAVSCRGEAYQSNKQNNNFTVSRGRSAPMPAMLAGPSDFVGGARPVTSRPGVQSFHVPLGSCQAARPASGLFAQCWRSEKHPGCLRDAMNGTAVATTGGGCRGSTASPLQRRRWAVIVSGFGDGGCEAIGRPSEVAARCYSGCTEAFGRRRATHRWLASCRAGAVSAKPLRGRVCGGPRFSLRESCNLKARVPARTGREPHQFSAASHCGAGGGR